MLWENEMLKPPKGPSSGSGGGSSSIYGSGGGFPLLAAWCSSASASYAAVTEHRQHK